MTHKTDDIDTIRSQYKAFKEAEEIWRAPLKAGVASSENESWKFREYQAKQAYLLDNCEKHLATLLAAYDAQQAEIDELRENWKIVTDINRDLGEQIRRLQAEQPHD